MQHAGTLRKRTRRTLVKVKGSDGKGYNEHDDYLNDIAAIWKSSKPPTEALKNLQKGLQNYHKSDSTGKFLNSERVTRNPIFPLENVDIEAGLNTETLQTQHALRSPRSPQDHPYLLSQASFNRIRAALFFGILVINAPWKWNRKTHRIDRWTPSYVKLWKAYWYFSTIQSAVMFVYHVHCLKGLYSSSLESYRGIFEYSMIIYWYVLHLTYRISIYIYEDQMRKYINLLLDFNQEYVDKYLLPLDSDIENSSARLIIYFSIPVTASQIANSLFFFVTMPYQSYYLTSLIDPMPWYAIIPGAIQDLTLVGQSIATDTIISWTLMAHTTSINFWLGEIHKSSENFHTTEELRTLQNSMSTFKRLQLLCRDYNECFSPMALPFWKLGFVGFIQCAYMTIRSMNELFWEEFPGILLYPFGALNCCTMIFGAMTLAAEMFDLANSFIGSWGQTKQKDIRRMLLSFPTLRVKMARFYFITTATTITCFQVLTGNLIDCLLTFP